MARIAVIFGVVRLVRTTSIVLCTLLERGRASTLKYLVGDEIQQKGHFNIFCLPMKGRPEREAPYWLLTPGIKAWPQLSREVGAVLPSGPISCQ
ncbi:hypothetical protein TNCT_301591 [Trichonephila clavata]|uniref:Secreted protein n=1 Tax=Trichonephila clavata TaxID=2740835 RepID=A0A8X6GWR7_TRICU|nr:hypothetical protein TNCT_301591 [Trichonephila clavata]